MNTAVSPVLTARVRKTNLYLSSSFQVLASRTSSPCDEEGGPNTVPFLAGVFARFLHATRRADLIRRSKKGVCLFGGPGGENPHVICR